MVLRKIFILGKSLKYLLVLLLFLFGLSVSAEDKYSIRVAHGWATSSDLGEILFGQIDGSYGKDLSVTSLDVGYLLYKEINDLPIDIYVKGSLGYFYEDNIHDDILETIIYIKAYYNIDFLDNRVRVGLAEGFSYTSHILYAEKRDALENQDNNSNFLNYLDISVDFDLGKLTTYKPLRETYVGWAIKHRSGVFGLINNVRHGGSNYNTFYIEKNF
jgi:outer membrane protein